MLLLKRDSLSGKLGVFCLEIVFLHYVFRIHCARTHKAHRHLLMFFSDQSDTSVLWCCDSSFTATF